MPPTFTKRDLVPAWLRSRSPRPAAMPHTPPITPNKANVIYGDSPPQSSSSSRQSDEPDHEGFRTPSLHELPATIARGCPTIDTSRYRVCYEWLGRKYLQSVVSRVVLLHCPWDDAPPTELDGRLDEFLAVYPYDKCCRFLASQQINCVSDITPAHLIGSVDFRATLLCWIGVLLQHGDRREKRITLVGLQQFADVNRVGCSMPADQQPQQPDASPTAEPNLAAVAGTVVPAPTTESGLSVPTSTSTAASLQLSTPATALSSRAEPGISDPLMDVPVSRFTSLLWEHAASFGAIPSYTDKTLSSFPPLYRATVHLFDKTAHGEDKQKKTARHLASQELCRALDIRPT